MAGTTRAEIQGNPAAEIGCVGSSCMGAGRMTSPDSIHLSVTTYDAYAGISTIEGQPSLALFGSCSVVMIACLNSQTTSTAKSNVVWGPFRLAPPSGMGEGSYGQAWRSFAQNWANDSAPYRYPGPNSNTFISNGLRSIGGSTPTFNFGSNWKAPGYGF
jgi:hypothetical protein